MRTIKFRAFNKETKKFIYSDWKYGVVSFWDEVINDFTKNYGLVQQFTGLKDKNDLDIYEGDIWNDTFGSGVVEFLECRFVIKWNDGGFGDLYSNVTTSHLPDCKVIGNIYQNT